MLTYVDKTEQRMESMLRTNFSNEINTLEESLDVLGACINENRLGKKEILENPELIDIYYGGDYKKFDATTKCLISSATLLGETLLRFYATRRLLLFGYLSRALASSRDAMESAYMAHICKTDEVEAERWQNGKYRKFEEKNTKNKCHEALDWDFWKWTCGTMSRYGTHALFDAAYLSSISQRTLIYPNHPSVTLHLEDIRAVLTCILLECRQLLLYIQDCYPKSISNMNEYVELIKQIETIVEDYKVI
jgi:hypothetical protein